LVKNAGFDYIEMHYHHRPDWIATELQKLVEDLDLIPYSIHLPKLMLSNPREQFNDDVDSIFMLIQNLGVKVSVLHPPLRQHLSEKEWMKRVEILLKKSSQTNCSLTFEIIPYLDDPHLFVKEQIKKHSNSEMGVTIDLEYMYLRNLDLQTLLDMFGGKVLNIHFRDSDGSLLDSDGKRKYIVPGEGEIDLWSVVDTLQTSGYDNAITIEVSYRDPDNIVRAKKYTDTLFEKIRKNE
jgi:sugar phosphate isomerase/epimerase